MLIVETIARIRRDHLDPGVPIRLIARGLNLSRNTIRKAIRGDVTSFRYERTVQPLPKLTEDIQWNDRLTRQRTRPGRMPSSIAIT